jgi:tRNA-dihydrouridine synthase C
VERSRDRLAGRQVRPTAADWPRVLPLLVDYWQCVRRDLEPRHAPGRIKQWLNLLRRNYAQGERLFQQLRLLREVTEIDQHMQRIVCSLPQVSETFAQAI